ncbi:MAG TPA: FecR family protein [Thermoanaerobaculia bacterium]|jgi:ferric-dicitrate binding protein FerR (iron transport regulator)|nr:FecR family protein [Thermoanaerobaculia bacterium]
MNEHEERSVDLGGPPTVDSDPVAQLVRLAGARPPVPAERAARVQERVQAAWSAGVADRQRARWTRWGVGLAAAAALALVAGLTWQRAERVVPPPAPVASVERVSGAATITGADGIAQPLGPGALVVLGAAVATGGDGRLALRLPGGPSLRLDVGTQLRFVAPAALALERGAVYVDSQGGPSLVVDTPWGKVEERGTQFEVRVATAGVRVRVREGEVELAGPRRAWQAAAGAELTLAADGRLSRRPVALHGEAWDWVQEIAPSYRLEGRPLGDFLGWVGRETGWRVAWADPARAAGAAEVVLHGSVEGLPPDQALAAVLPTCGLASRRDGDTVVVFDSR